MTDIRLGETPAEHAERDAIHVAIAPVIAACEMIPGAHAGLDSDGRATTDVSPLGIVDPFLNRNVKA